MACFWIHQSETNVKIGKVEDVASVTYYRIEVEVADVKWTVAHRYSEFYELHNHLVADHGVSRDLLPPKKAIRNKSPEFIESRRKGLENYLKCMLNYLKITMPRPFVEFLDFHVYDIFFLLRNLAAHLFTEADVVLSSSKAYTFIPLQLHAISECFKKPFPAIEDSDKRYDVTHVLDLCSQLELLDINGSDQPYLNSNIIPNKLHVELTSFKALKALVINGMPLMCVDSVGNLRDTLEKLHVHKSGSKGISEILQCDAVHKSSIDETQMWRKIVEIDFTDNRFDEIDETINLVPQLITLILDHNRINTIKNLAGLTNLTYLSICDNLITNCENIHMKLGNVKTLVLSQNQIRSLKDFGKLYSLESLDLSCNQITDVEEAAHIGDLPCLENLVLTGNAVATIVDYRVKVLEHFGERAKEICLDNERPSQSELDKVLILRALRIVKEGKTPNLSNLCY